MRKLYRIDHPVRFLIFVGLFLNPTFTKATNSLLERCPVPRSVMVHDVTDSSAEVSFYASDSSLIVALQWREVGSPDWTVIPDVESPAVLTSLNACTEYELRLQAYCNGSESSFSELVQFESDGCCRIPTDIRLIESTNTSAVIGWDEVTFAFVHHIRYRTIGDVEWTELEADTNRIVLNELAECAAYEIQVGSQCDLDSTEFSSSFLWQTIACGTCTESSYCAAAGDDSSTEWIDSLSFGGIRLRTGSNDGYLLLNTTQTGIERTRNYSFHVRPGSLIPDATFYLRMWIDLNQDGIFTDSTELLVDPVFPITTSGWTQNINIPDSITLGQTRMRVALESIVGVDTLRPHSCGSFLFGEVEDYCISIDDVCPEVQPSLRSVTETSAVVSWPEVDESIVFVYRYRNIEDSDFSEPELTQDTIVEITGLEKCETYVLQTLSVCVQDTSSWLEFIFETECPPNAVKDEFQIVEYWRAYPNPFSDQLTLEFKPVISGEGVLRLFNLYGVEVQNAKFSMQQEAVQILQLDDLNVLPSGMYLLSLEVNQQRQLLKVIK